MLVVTGSSRAAAATDLHLTVLPPPSGCAPVAPPIVFLPALGFTGESLVSVARRIAACRSRILVDLPGTGRSTPADVQPTRVLSQLTSVLADSGTIVVGHSIGGTIAVRLAAASPSRIGGLVLIDAPVEPFALSWWERAALHPSAWVPMLHVLGAVHCVRAAFHYMHETPSSDVAESAKILARELSTPSSRSVLVAYHDAFLRRDGLDAARTALTQIRVPVLVLWGADDRVVPAKMMDEIRHSLPPSTPVTARSFAGGHLLPLEKPKVVAAAISEFARSVQSSER